MSKLVLPPPQQPFVTTAGHVTDPWRVYLDGLTHNLNNSRQLIAKGEVVSGTSAFTVVLPSGVGRAEVSYDGIQPNTNAVGLRAQVSTDNGVTFLTTYKFTRHIISVESTVSGVITSTNTSDIQVAGNLSTLSSGGVTGIINVFNSTRGNIFWNNMALQDATTPNVTVNNGGAWVEAGGPINAIKLMVTTGTFTTGSYAVYGER